MAVLVIFILIPTVVGLLLSFFDWDGGPVWTAENGWALPEWRGLDNYARLINDPDVGHGLRNTLVFSFFSVPPSVLIAFLLASALQAEWFVGRNIVRTLLFMPTIVSIVAVGFAWQWVLDKNGLLNAFLAFFGVEERRSWLAGDQWPMVWIILIQIWRSVGFSVLLYMAAMAGIPKSLYEAAEIDGAGSLSKLRHITWTQVKPMTIFLTVTGVITALQVFDLIYIMTGQAITPATTVLNYEVYEQFTLSNYGYASAIGALIFVITVVATLIQVWIGRNSEGGR